MMPQVVHTSEVVVHPTRAFGVPLRAHEELQVDAAAGNFGGKDALRARLSCSRKRDK